MNTDGKKLPKRKTAIQHDHWCGIRPGGITHEKKKKRKMALKKKRKIGIKHPRQPKTRGGRDRVLKTQNEWMEKQGHDSKDI